MKIYFNKTLDGSMIVPQPHFNLIYDALHISKSVEKFKALCETYPQLLEIPCKGKVAISFDSIN